MNKVIIIVELVDGKQLNVSGPLEYNRELCVQMLTEALKIAKTYKGAGLLIANDALVTDMSKNHINHQIRKQF